MNVVFRPAAADDLPAIVALLADDVIGAGRESADLAPYRAAFAEMAREPHNHLIVGDMAGRVVAVYQLTFISGLSRQAARRAQVESVRVAADLRGAGLGARMMRDAEDRARAAGCGLLQLTTQAERGAARAFYDRLGYTPSHIGYKLALD